MKQGDQDYETLKNEFIKSLTQSIPAHKGIIGAWKLERDEVVSLIVSELIEEFKSRKIPINHVKANIEKITELLVENIADKAKANLASTFINPFGKQIDEEAKDAAKIVADYTAIAVMDEKRKLLREQELQKAQIPPTTPKAELAAQDATTNKVPQAEHPHPKKEEGAVYKRYTRKQYLADRGSRPLHEIAKKNPIMVAGLKHKEGSIVLKTILEAQSDDGKPPLSTAALNAKVNKAIEDALGTGRLKEAIPERTGNTTTYKVGGETLTQTKDDSDKLSFKPSNGFTGVLRVQRANPTGGLIPGAFDAFEYKDGKPIGWSLSDKGVSRVSDIMKKSFEQAVTVVGLPSSLSEQVTGPRQHFSPTPTPTSNPSGKNLGGKAAGED